MLANFSILNTLPLWLANKYRIILLYRLTSIFTLIIFIFVSIPYISYISYIDNRIKNLTILFFLTIQFNMIMIFVAILISFKFQFISNLINRMIIISLILFFIWFYFYRKCIIILLDLYIRIWNFLNIFDMMYMF